MKKMKLLISVFTLCLMSPKANATQRPEVTGTMRGIFNSLMNLQPYLVNEKKFKDPKNHAAIKKELKALEGVKHAFPKKLGEEEPGAAIMASLFTDYIQDIQKRYKSGDYEYARHRARTASGFCFSCHSRVHSSLDFEDLSKRVASLGLTPLEKADLFAATRQFDKALVLYREILASQPKDEMGLILLLRGLRRAVAITIRVKGNAKETLELVESVSNRKDLPLYVKRFTEKWKQDIQGWMEEKTTEKLSGEALVEKAEKYIERASVLQSFPADENGDISYLRASNYLHEALDGTPKASYRSKALYLLGVAYSSVQDPSLWDIDQIYFEACVRENPKGEYAKKCYDRYANRIYLGYTGSAGTNIPEEEIRKLTSLRKLME